MELEVGEVRLAPRQRSHRVERGVGVARDPEVVGVNVDGMGQPELVHGSADRLEHLARRHLEAFDLVVERVDVAVALLPQLHPAGIHELHPIATGGVEPPRHRVLDPVPARPHGPARLPDQLEQHLVVAHQDQERLVDHRRVAQLGEHVARGQRRGGRLDDRGVAEQRVPIAGGERGRDQPAGARAEHVGSIHRLVAPVLRGQLAGGVHLRAGDVGVDVDATGHHDHPPSVDAAGVGSDVGDHLAVLQAHVADLAVDVVGGVVDGAATDSDRRHRCDLVEQPCQQHRRRRRIVGLRRLQRQRDPVEPVGGAGGGHARGRGADRHGDIGPRRQTAQCDLGHTGGEVRGRGGRALNQKRHVDALPGGQRRCRGDQLRMTAGKIHTAGIPGLPGQHVVRASRPGSAR